jgi:hypothetical protein
LKQGSFIEASQKSTTIFERFEAITEHPFTKDDEHSKIHSGEKPPPSLKKDKGKKHPKKKKVDRDSENQGTGSEEINPLGNPPVCICNVAQVLMVAEEFEGLLMSDGSFLKPDDGMETSVNMIISSSIAIQVSRPGDLEE